MFWASFEQAVKYYVLGHVTYAVGDFNFVIRGGSNKHSQQISTAIVNSIFSIETHSYGTRSLKVKLSNVALFERDNFTCCYCGGVFSSVDLTRDHVIPKSRGGANNWTNCVTACHSCNSRKGNKTPKEANMTTIYKPYAPTKIHLLKEKNKKFILEDQERYLREFY